MRMKIFQILLLLCPIWAIAQPYNGKVVKPIQARAADCAPPTARTYLQTNNVRALIHTAGNLWQVPGQNFSQYEVPKNSGIMALFTAALWLGGTDVNGQLKLAALRYRNGQDYWTGPISQGPAITNYATCQKYDQHYTTTQDMIRQFNAWYESGVYDQINGTNTQGENFPNYQVPKIIKEWPAHGDVTAGQDYYLAPFYDRDNDGNYDWDKGDFPWYDIKKTKSCSIDREVSLYGDENFWWIMNDKGNIHTETGSDPIGMEIRAQAFAFATNDEVNNMTFYNYELINRGTQTLYNTYFGFFADAALGNPFDDYVGCDVNRGLAYVYNGDSYDDDNNGFKGYGANPASVGVDFFEGPFQDNDQIDNAFGIGPNEALNGIGYGDGIIDNERFGMRRFLYYINTGGGANPNQTDPITGSDYYNYLRGFWKDGTPFYYGGSGYISSEGVDPTVKCDFMFPGDTDPLGWGTGGVPQPLWTEETAGNEPYDRRFVQSAGPFILKPGSINNITVGIVWARAPGGGPFASVEVLRRADDKAQALFENCFKVLDGPHAPDLGIQELENELILTLSNPINSNNAKEDYAEFDPFISTADSSADKFYRFQGYMIYQVTSPAVSASEIEDISKARLVAQCDLKDDVATLINFEYDEELQTAFPVKKVQGENKGIKHSFSVTEDLFAQGNRRLVNFKRYYYLAVSYAYNNYKKYDPSDPQQLDGQKKPFIASRKAAIGEIKTLEAIPHNPVMEAGGTIQLMNYGNSPQITRLDGIGNGNIDLELTKNSLLEILTTGFAQKPTYDYGSGPLNIKVVDPLNLVGGYFECVFRNYTNLGNDQFSNYAGTDTASWVINRYDYEGGNLLESVASERTIKNQNEQIIAKWGISVEIVQNKYFKATTPNGPDPAQSQEFDRTTLPISSSIEFSDSSKRWLSFINDNDSYFPSNWILAGLFAPTGADTSTANPIFSPGWYKDEVTRDPQQYYEKLLGGGIAPHSLVAYKNVYSPLAYPIGSGANLLPGGMVTTLRGRSSISRAPSVDIVLTSDKSKWTRCAVIELGKDAALNVGQATAGTLRKSPSVDQNGNPIGGSTGMGWFPGYAIDVETGMRLHMAFGENSFLGGDNGSDMIWNPTDRLVDNNGLPIFGGQHAIYIYGYNINGEGCPFYDGTNNWVYDRMAENTTNGYKKAFTSLTWVLNPILTSGQELLDTDVKMRVRINKEYSEFTATGKNGGKPMYSWKMDDIRTVTGSQDQIAESLRLINVVPNPYYAYSTYEKSRLDTRIKITNLPEVCTIKIYNVSGKLIKTIKKANPTTFEDWNIKNEKGIPVSSGVYLIHVNVPNVGEVVLKSFIAMRTPDMENL